MDKRRVRINEVATNYKFMENIVHQGTNCVRMSCDRDNADIVKDVSILDQVRMQAHQVKKIPQLRALHCW